MGLWRREVRTFFEGKRNEINLATGIGVSDSDTSELVLGARDREPVSGR
jgi:hypothetical protein